MLETNTFGAGDEPFWCWRRTLLVLETNALKTRVRTSVTNTAIYQRVPNRPYIEMLVPHLRKRKVSRFRTHLRVRYTHKLYNIYAIVFSAGLNGLQVDQVDRENDKRTSTYRRVVPSNWSQPVTHVFSTPGVA